MTGTHLRWLLLLLTTTLTAAKKEIKKQESQAPALTSAELAHQRPFFRLGDGFEGTASDWTEYVVWLVGVIGVLMYMGNPNMRRNLHAMEGDTPLNERVQDDDDDDGIAKPSPSSSSSSSKNKKSGRAKKTE